MLKLSLLALIVAFNVHAEKAADTSSQPAAGQADEMHYDSGEQQDGEEFAVSPGNPAAGDNPNACLSADTVKRYEKKAAKAVKSVKTVGKGYSPRNVLKALKKGGLVKEDAKLSGSAKNDGPALKKLKFVNLLECKEWRDKIKDGGGNVPLGAVMVYTGGKHGDMRLKTPSGCLGSNGKTCVPLKQKLIGVYVQIAN